MSILSLIGMTPMVEIKRLYKKKNVRIFAKLEGFNPTGSIKDRIALKMITSAEHDGSLTPGKTIIEATSGNTGISLAMIGAIKGYPVVMAMCEAVSVERRKLIAAYGGKIILTPAEEGTDGAIRLVRELVSKHPDKYFSPDQFSNQYNKLAHYKTTAEEIWRQTDGKITHFVSAVGTSGTIMGVGRGLRENNPSIKIIEAQPVRGHYIQGLKNMQEAIVPSIYDENILSGRVMIETEEAFAMARRIIKEEGLCVGMSSGAAMIAAIKTAEEIDCGIIVAIMPDRSEKYLSTALFNNVLTEENMQKSYGTRCEIE